MPLSGKRKPYAALNLDFISSSALPDTVTFSRGTAATQYDSTGALTQAPQNLLTYSEQFDNAAWTKTNTTVTPNVATAPDGTVTADKVIPSATNADHTVSGSAGTAASGAVYTVSVYAKAGEYNFIRLSLGGVAGGGFTFFNVATGVVGTTSGMLSNSISSVGGGWYRCSVTRAATSSAGIAGDVYVTSADNQFSWSGNGTSGVYLWGAQVEQRSTSWAYNATTSAAYYGPRFDYDPASLVYQNLLLQSQTFDNAYWTKGNASVVADTVAAPDGTFTAEGLVESVDGAASFHTVLVTGTAVSGAAYTVSLYVKAANRTYFEVSPVSGVGVNFNLTTGAVNFTYGGGAGTITSVGNGWYRLAVTATLTAGTATQTFLIGGPTGATSYVGTGVLAVYIWGAQLNTGSTALPYYATTSAAYTQCAPNGLLIEEQRTNILPNSTAQGAVAGTPGTVPTGWATVTTANGLSTSVVGTGVSGGIAYLDMRISGTTTAASSNALIYMAGNTALAATNGQAWASSGYYAIVGGSTTNILSINTALRFNDIAGTALTSQDINFTSTLTGTMKRYSQSLTAANASTAFVNNYVWLNYNSGVAIDITLRIGLPQLELGAFATSVIPTYGAAATRNADTASMTGTNFSSWYNATQGTLYAEYSRFAAVNFQAVAYLGTPAQTDYMALVFGSLAPANNQRFDVGVGGVSQASIAVLTAPALNTITKTVGTYALNDFAATANGAVPGVDAAGTVPTVSSMGIGTGTALTGPYLNGWIRSIRYYPTRLPNATLQGLTV